MNALILVGGKSTRMGTDKSKLVYFNKSQDVLVFEMLKKIVEIEHIYFSVNANQVSCYDNTLVDIYPEIGPLGAIYTAFKANKTTAWLVIAIDIPFLNLETLKNLIKNRDQSKIATTFQGVNKKYPEPLITIWEPKSMPLLQENIKHKNYSLTNILMKSDIKKIAINDTIIDNINTKKDYNKVIKQIKK